MYNRGQLAKNLQPEIPKMCVCVSAAGDSHHRDAAYVSSKTPQKCHKAFVSKLSTRMSILLDSFSLSQCDAGAVLRPAV